MGEESFRRKMRADEHHLQWRTAKAKRKLHKMKVLIVRIKHEIKRFKTKMSKQAGIARVLERKRGLMLRRERIFELSITTKIRALKVHFRKEKGRLGALLKKREKELRHVRAQTRMLSRRLSENGRRTTSMAKILRREAREEKREARLLKAKEHQRREMMLGLKKSHHEMKKKRAESFLHHNLRDAKKRLHKLGHELSVESARAHRQSHEFVQKIMRLKKELLERRERKRRNLSELRVVLKELKKREAKNKHEKQVLAMYRIRMKNGRHKLKLLKGRIAKTNRQLGYELRKLAKVELLLRFKLHSEDKVTQELSLLHKRMAMERKNHHKKRIHLLHQLRYKRRIYRKLERRLRHERRRERELLRKLNENRRKEVLLRHRVWMMKGKNVKLLHRIRRFERRRHARTMAKRARGRRELEKRRRMLSWIAKYKHLAQEKQVKLNKALKHEQWERSELASLMRRSQKLMTRRELHVRQLQKDLVKLSWKVKHAREKYVHVMKMLYEARRLKAREHTKFLKWRRNKEKEVMLLRHKVKITTRRLLHLAYLHSKRIRAAKHRLIESQKALKRWRARKIHEERHQTHYFMRIIHRKQLDLHKLKLKYVHIMREVEGYKAKRHNLKIRAYARWVKFKKEFKALKAKAQHLYALRMREGRSYHALEHKIKKWEHKKRMLERAQKRWRRRVELIFKERMRRFAHNTAETRRKVQRYKRGVQEIHERDLIRARKWRRHLSGMKNHLNNEKRLVAHLRAILAKEKRKTVRQLMALKRQKEEARELKRLEAKRLKELHARQRLKRRQEAEIFAERRHLHDLETRWFHERRRYSTVRLELEKTKQK